MSAPHVDLDGLPQAEQLLADARTLMDRTVPDRRQMERPRVLLGVCGAPGSGKSTLAGWLVSRLGPAAVVVPMDGFHLHDDELARLGLSERKGAPETFDVDGYVELLGRLRREVTRTVYAPSFDRSLEVAVAGAIACRPEHRLVVTEGNYLLHDAPPWTAVASLLDRVWFVEQPEQTRVARLVERHVAHGRSPVAAHRWATGSDQANADLVAASSDGADLLVTMG